MVRRPKEPEEKDGRRQKLVDDLNAAGAGFADAPGGAETRR
jgi:hypothetical protein